MEEEGDEEDEGDAGTVGRGGGGEEEGGGANTEEAETYVAPSPWGGGWDCEGGGRSGIEITWEGKVMPLMVLGNSKQSN